MNVIMQMMMSALLIFTVNQRSLFPVFSALPGIIMSDISKVPIMNVMIRRGCGLNGFFSKKSSHQI